MAQIAKGTTVLLQTALAAAKTITAITAASPPVVTSTAHAYTNGQVVKITGVVGMVELNNRAFVVANVTANTFELKGVDATAYTTYASGGSAFLATMSAIGEVRGIPSFGGTEPNNIDVSHLLSLTSENVSGLPRQSDVSFNVLFDLATAQHTNLIKANQDLSDKVLLFQKTGSFYMSVVAQVSGFNVTAGDVNSPIEASVTLAPRAVGTWAANP